MVEIARSPGVPGPGHEESVWPAAFGFAVTFAVVGWTLSVPLGLIGSVVTFATVVGWAMANAQKRIEEGVKENREGGKDRLWWGAVTLIISEAMLFVVGFIFLYAYGILHDPQAPKEFKELNRPLVLVFSVLLWTSGLTGYLSSQSLKKGHHQRFIGWLVLTIILGVVFLVYQMFEYHSAYGKGFTLDSGRVGSVFYALTGLHGIHVIIGLVALVGAVLYGVRGHFRNDIAPFHAIMLYWHFVDIVWVFIYAALYLKVLG